MIRSGAWRARLAAILPVALVGFVCGCASTTPAAGRCGPCQASPGGTAGLTGAGMPRSPKLDALARKRVDLARKRLAEQRASFDAGKATLDELFAACRDVAFAARDSGMHGEALRQVLDEYLGAVTALRDLMRERAARSAGSADATRRIDGLVAEAEYWVEEAKP